MPRGKGSPSAMLRGRAASVWTVQLNGRGEERKVWRDPEHGAFGLPGGWRPVGNQYVRHEALVDFR